MKQIIKEEMSVGCVAKISHWAASALFGNSTSAQTPEGGRMGKALPAD